MANWSASLHRLSRQIATVSRQQSHCGSWGAKKLHTLAASVLVVELQAGLAAVGDGIAASVEVTGTSLVACSERMLERDAVEGDFILGIGVQLTDGASAAAAGIAVDGSDGRGLADLEAVGGSGSSKAESGDDESECVHFR